MRAHVEGVSVVFEEGLRGVEKNTAVVGEVRIAGLMAAVELVRDRDSREPAPEITARTIAALAREGVLAYPGGVHDNVICFTPPLTITEEQIRYAVEALARVLPG